MSSKKPEDRGDGRDRAGLFAPGNRAGVGGPGGHGGPPGHTKAITHGLFWLRKVLKGGKIRKLKGVSRAIERIKAELTGDLGGDPSTQEKVVIDDIAKSLVLVYCIDAYLFDLSNLFDTKGVQGWMEERRRLAEHVVKDLKVIGMKRVARGVNDLDTFLASITPDPDQGEGLRARQSNERRRMSHQQPRMMGNEA